MSKETPRPVHRSFQSVSSDLIFDSLVEMTGALAYQDFQNVSSDLTFNNLKQSGYQYLLGTVIQENVTEAVGSLDSATKIVRKTAHEFAGTVDIADFRPIRADEFSGSLDTAIRKVIKTAHEYAGSLDMGSPRFPHPITEGAGVADRATRIVRKTAHEFFGSLDSSSGAITQRQFFTTKIQGMVTQDEFFTSKIQGTALQQGNFSTNIINLINDLVGATATGGSNPFDPSVAIGGNTIIGPTAPVAAKTVYISIPNTGISTLPNWSSLNRFGLSLNYGGGSFNISSFLGSPPGALGQQITLFGLKGAITRGGNTAKEYSSTHKGFTASGIMGSLALNRQINFSVGGNVIASPIVLNPSLLQASTRLWLSAKTIASLMGQICGVNVIWTAQDVPVKDFSLEPGMKGIDVIRSMASRVGAELRWFGNDTYYVAYPNFSIGNFTVANQALIAQGGISSEPILDLETGVTGGGVSQGYYVVPQTTTTSSINGSAPAPLPQSQSSAPTVVEVCKVKSLLTSEDPPMIFDLPYNYDQVYIQILINPGQSTGGANQLGIQNFVTADPKQVFLFSDVGFANNYVFQTLVGNAYIPQTKVDFRLMPENDAVQAGNFVLTIFCTLKDLNDAYDAAKADADNNAAAVASRNPQFIKTYEGKINCLFYGVLPLPGMWGSATVDDYTVEGIIENVTFTPPGLLAIDVARYKRINFVQPLNQINTLT